MWRLRLETSLQRQNRVFQGLTIIIIIIIIIIMIIMITLFQENNIFGRVASLAYGPQLTNVGMICQSIERPCSFE